ncbi:MAG: hypothetical protein GW942_02475 [Candidatus Pacebacteria bacterium]|nr:hypothetical protein [Candidatus Paceibacterota bacterium]
MIEQYSLITGSGFSCVDGRPAGAVISKNQQGLYVVERSKDVLRDTNNPQLLGAGLGFVAMGEKIANLSQEDAFKVSEDAMAEVGYNPQFHVDNHHDKIDISQLSDEELIVEIAKYLLGCGFAAYNWGDNAIEYLQMAWRRGWDVEVLVGNHGEKGANKNKNLGEQSFNVHLANESGTSKFNQDYVPVKRVLDQMGEILRLPDNVFATPALNLLDTTFDDVVVALKGVENKEEIETI